MTLGGNIEHWSTDQLKVALGLPPGVPHSGESAYQAFVESAWATINVATSDSINEACEKVKFLKEVYRIILNTKTEVGIVSAGASEFFDIKLPKFPKIYQMIRDHLPLAAANKVYCVLVKLLEHKANNFKDKGLDSFFVYKYGGNDYLQNIRRFIIETPHEDECMEVLQILENASCNNSKNDSDCNENGALKEDVIQKLCDRCLKDQSLASIELNLCKLDLVGLAFDMDLKGTKNDILLMVVQNIMNVLEKDTSFQTFTSTIVRIRLFERLGFDSKDIVYNMILKRYEYLNSCFGYEAEKAVRATEDLERWSGVPSPYLKPLFRQDGEYSE
ncbi:MAG: hypothetical protein WC806_04630 [Candidatus Gracilibacteria bacterium]|jgi:hypothetical protein